MDHDSTIMPPLHAQLLTFAELAELFGVPESKIRDLHKRRRIPHVRLGYRTVRFDPKAVTEALTVPPRTTADQPQA
jgi:excisionase family DNA binding protein